MSKQLFETFDKVSKASWKQKILEDLQGEDFDRLVWQTREGYAVQPFYTEEDLEDVNFLSPYQNATLRRNGQAREWENREMIPVKEEKAANSEALLALDRGADGVCFDVSTQSTCDLDALLKGVYLQHCAVSFVASPDFSLELARRYQDYATRQNIAVSALTGSINFDPLAIGSTRGTFSDTAFDDLARMVSLYKEAPDFRVVTINSSTFHNAGCHAVQELAFTLSAAVETVNQVSDRKVQPARIVQSLSFCMSTGSDYFTEIAKLKALRILFYQIVRAYGIADFNPGDISVHSVSSLWNKSAIDPRVNMLRNTTEAMSAILGGCNALSILPHDLPLQEPSGFSKRIARNVSNLLREESYFNKVADPAAGSYYLENLTALLAGQAWKLFQEVEREGGYRESFKRGMIQQKIKTAREAARQKTATRETVIVGVNQYVDPHLAFRPTSDQKAVNDISVLSSFRQSADFERVRARTAQYLAQGGDPGKVRVHIAILGSSSQAKARAGFVRGFMATGGFVSDTAPFTDPEESVRKVMETSAATLILCGADDDYAQSAREFIRKADTHGKILLMAAPPEKIPASIASVVQPVYQGVNAIELISAIQDKLNIAS